MCGSEVRFLARGVDINSSRNNCWPQRLHARACARNAAARDLSKFVAKKKGLAQGLPITNRARADSRGNTL